MIKLQVEDYCHQNCERFEPVADTDSISFSEYGKPDKKITRTIVRCVNASMCQAIYTDLAKKFGKEE